MKLSLQEQINNFKFRYGPCNIYICTNSGSDMDAIKRVYQGKKPLTSLIDQKIVNIAKEMGLTVVTSKNGPITVSYIWKPGSKLNDFWDPEHVIMQYKAGDIKPPDKKIFNLSFEKLLDELTQENIVYTGLLYGYPIESTIALLARNSISASEQKGTFKCTECKNVIDYNDDSESDSN